MVDKSLKDKAIQIQGKDYVLVSDRVIYFNETYPNGSIETILVSDYGSDIIVVKARVIPNTNDPADQQREFTGYSQAVKGAGFINKTAALENAETSAVGRALAFMGIGVIDSIASSDEINKAQGTDYTLAKAKQDLYSEFQKAGIMDSMGMSAEIMQATGKDSVETVNDAKKVIEHLKK